MNKFIFGILVLWVSFARAGCVSTKDIYIEKMDDIYYSSDSVGYGLSKNEFIITIDDGPGSNTKAVLDILKKYCVKAHFFFIGNKVDSGAVEIFDYIRDGHVVGLHGYTHRVFVNIPRQELSYEVDKSINSVKKASGYTYTPSFFRFPNFVQDYRVFPVLKRNDIIVVGADISPADWKMDGHEAVLGRFFEILKTKDRGIVVLHENSGLPDVLDRILGYFYLRNSVIVRLHRSTEE